ncbi:MAG: Zn-dependent hydrolase, partial [Bryobacterales bacterium]|nr:Zn-dependent hydrolase [Bryobacterales bacterium]
MRAPLAFLLIALALLLGAAPLDLAPRVAKWQRVNMPLDLSSLSSRDKQVVRSLIAASQQIEAIYWRQSDPAGLQLLLRTKDRDLKRMLMINGGRFDLIDENRPLIGDQAAPPGRALYPPNLTAEKIREYVAKHPAQKASIYSPYTVVVSYGADLRAIPYHTFYATWLKGAADRLREAAGESADPQFAVFLRMRADALLTDDYYKSDLAWI